MSASSSLVVPAGCLCCGPAVMQVVREAYPDLTAQDKGSKYYDAKASPEDPRWSMVDFKLVRNNAWVVFVGTGACCTILQRGLSVITANAPVVHTTPGCSSSVHKGCHP